MNTAIIILLKIKLLISCFLISPSGIAQPVIYTLSGHIYDQNNYETLIGAAVFDNHSKVGTVSNAYGFYSISLPEGHHEITFSFLGFETQSLSIVLTGNKALDIFLREQGKQMEEIVITEERVKAEEFFRSTDMSIVNVNVKTLQKLPALFGEIDVIKAIQMLPGVQTVGEGSSGLYVRGGNMDQNLILLDEAPVYNASHLGGFLSTFNPDAIKDVKVYKGAFPTNYGGRLSSVIDIRMKDGNRKHFTAKGGIGSMMSRLSLESPLGDNGSLFVAGRRTYLDALFKAAESLSGSNEEERNDFTMYFYDLNAKGNYRIGENDRLFISGYFGRDVYGFESKEDNAYLGFNWGNATGTARWNHLFSPKLFSNLIYYYSHYDYHLNFRQDLIRFNWDSGLKEHSLKYDFTYYANPDHKLRFGLQTILHHISPGKIEVFDDEEITGDLLIQRNQSIETAAYINHDWELTDKIVLNAGLRLSSLLNLGPNEVFPSNHQHQVTDTLKYGKGIYHAHWRPEPRISLRYQLGSANAFKVSYTRAAQYIQMASNGNFSSPFDIWFTSSPNIRPQLADQWAFGFFSNMIDNAISVSAEVFYKKLTHAIDFRDHAELLFNENLENEIRSGKGKAYGFEFLIQKNKGKWTGWLGYTYSRARRQINDINNNKWYNAKYDKPHSFSAVLSYDYSKIVSIGANFTHATGGAVTFPTGGYDFYGTRVPIYSERNGARLPDYQRLDLSITLRSELNDYKKFKTEWVFGVYNFLGRKNAFAIAFSEDENNPGTNIAEKISLFNWVPSVTFNFIY